MSDPHSPGSHIPPAGTEYDPRMGMPHVIGGTEHDGHPGETCADALFVRAIRSAGTPPASTPEAFDAAGFAAVVVQRDRMTDLYGQCKAELAAFRATPPEPVGGRAPVRESVVAAAVEWVEAHDALALGNPTGPPDSELLERYSEACNDLLAVVSQNRSALQASPPTGVSDGAVLDDQCPERCLGIVGHAGPHQTSDYEPPLRAARAAVEARDRELRAAVEALRGVTLLVEKATGFGGSVVERDAVLRLLGDG